MIKEKSRVDNALIDISKADDFAINSKHFKILRKNMNTNYTVNFMTGVQQNCNIDDRSKGKKHFLMIPRITSRRKYSPFSV